MSLSFLASLNAVSADDWDSLLSDTQPFYVTPFSARWKSGSVGAESGWQPAHLARFEQGRLRAALPGYGKSHSGANMSLTTAGRTPAAAPVFATIRNGWARCRSARSAGRGCWATHRR